MSTYDDADLALDPAPRTSLSAHLALLPAAVVGVALVGVAIYAALRSGEPGLLIGLALSQLLTAFMMLVCAWVVSRRASAWSLPLVGALALLSGVGVYLGTHPYPDHAYYVPTAVMACLALLVVVALAGVGLVGARRAARGEGGGGWTWTSFGLIVGATPWVGIMILLATMDTPLERAFTPQWFIQTMIVALVLIAASGLVAAHSKVAIVVGALLLAVYTTFSIYDLLQSTDPLLSMDPLPKIAVILAGGLAVLLSVARLILPSPAVRAADGSGAPGSARPAAARPAALHQPPPQQP